MSLNNDNNPLEEIRPPTNDDAGGSNNNLSTQHATDEPESHFMEGYTLMPVNNDDSDGDDYNYTEMNGEEFSNNGYYHMLEAPPKRVNGVKDHAMGYSMGHHENSDDDDSVSFENQNATDTTSSELHIPDDFLILAEQALRGLEDEHRETLELSSAHIPTINGDTVARPILVDGESVATSIPPPINDATEVNEELGGNITTGFERVFPPLEAAASEPMANTPEQTPMDVNAIQKAMQSIRLKSPQLAITLDAGASSSFSPSSAALQTSLGSVINFTCQSIQSMERQNINKHAIVPTGPLVSFRRSTTKAKSASANLSRSATLSEAVLRLWPLISFRRRMRVMGSGEQKSSKTLTIHILGCDRVECSSEETLRKSVGPFARWMSAVLQSGVLSAMQTSSIEIDSLVIEISGPNVPDWILCREINLLSSSSESGGLVSATAVFRQREYHENMDEAGVTPDLAIAFNAGLWGYDSWKPTLSCMCNSLGNGSYTCTLFVITAYTIEECEDDAEVVSEVAEEVVAKRMHSSKHDNAILAHQLWAPEPNPFSSRIERKTASVPRKYYENKAWQAWLLGPSTSAK